VSEPDRLPLGILEGFLRLSQGDFAFRLPRTLTRDEADTAAFFFNAIAEEVERIIRAAREQEQRLARTVDALTEALVRVAAGDLGVRVERDFLGDPIDVLAYLVNGTIDELATLAAERQRDLEADRERLAREVEERNSQLRATEEDFRQLFEAAPAALLMARLDDGEILAANSRVKALLGLDEPGAPLQAPQYAVVQADLERLVDLARRQGTVDGFSAQLRNRRGEPFWAEIAARLVRFRGQQALLAGLRNVSPQRALEERLRELATTDGLTGLLNRRRLMEVAEEEMTRATRYGRPLCLGMLDLDHFKAVNDRFGHLVGDDALRTVAEAVKGELRRYDQAGRYGGEEFVVILPETSLEAGRTVLERIRDRVSALRLGGAAEGAMVTASIGLVEWRPGEPLGAAIQRADGALYQAKRAGRNRVVAAP